MHFPDWRVVLGGLGLLGAIAWLRSRPGAPEPPAEPAGPVARGQLLSSSPVTVADGRTYFVVLETNGIVSAAATPSRIESESRKRGFVDVVVFPVRPALWPGTARGDFYVRGTYRGEPRAFKRHVAVPFGSANLLDVWET